MASCMSCGNKTLFTTKFRNVVLCKSCSSIINIAEWKDRDFSSIDELIEMKCITLQKAAGNISQPIIYEIVEYFNEYINAGFITSFNGKSGQTLKIFKDYCIISTKNEIAKNALENTFFQFVSEENDYIEEEKELLSSSDKKKLAKNLLSGNILKAGVSVAISAGIRQQEYEKKAAQRAKQAERRAKEIRKKIDTLITVGERKVEFKNISNVEIYTKINAANGYLKFIRSGANSNDMFDCDYFFFNNSIPFKSKKIKEDANYARKIIIDKISSFEQDSIKAKIEEVLKEHYSKTDSFNEIRKYKQLLDDGIISEAEFNIKKQQILGL